MGKRLPSQRRGKGSVYRAPSHRYKSSAKYPNFEHLSGRVVDLVHDPGHSAVLAKVLWDSGVESYILSPEGQRVGDRIGSDGKVGDVMELASIPEGRPIFNLELRRGDGGSLARGAGTSITIVSRDRDWAMIKLPSGGLKRIRADSRATIGVASGGGRKEKPFLKAGKKSNALRSKARRFPVVSGVAKNPVDHPHGGGAHQHVGGPGSVARGAPSGQKVGSIAPRRTGKR
jgi:large subunit ribosomal protein L2